jgi:hypothetical protein
MPGFGYGFSESGSETQKIGVGRYSTGTSTEYENDKFAASVLIFQPGNICTLCCQKLATGRYHWIPNYFDIPFFFQTLNSMFSMWPTVVQILIRCLSNFQNYMVHWTAKAYGNRLGIKMAIYLYMAFLW